jgi:hypothetical protein
MRREHSVLYWVAQVLLFVEQPGSGKPYGTSPVSRLDFDLTFRPLPASPAPPRPLRTQRA